MDPKEAAAFLPHLEAIRKAAQAAGFSFLDFLRILPQLLAILPQILPLIKQVIDLFNQLNPPAPTVPQPK